MITLKPGTYEALREYAEAIIEVCAPAKLDPVKLLVETDSYGRVAKKLDMCEFICGAFNIMATDLGVPMSPLWAHVSAGLEVPAAAKGRQAKAKPSNPKAGLHTLPHPKPPQIARAKDFATPVDRVVVPLGAGRPIPVGVPIAVTVVRAPAPCPNCTATTDRQRATTLHSQDCPVRARIASEVAQTEAKRGKAEKPPKPPKAPKPAKVTRKARREAAQPRLDL